MKKTLLFTIATGEYYNLFVKNLFNSLNTHIKFDFDFICFTDNTQNDDIKKIKIKHLNWPFGTLMRYHNIIDNKELFNSYEYVLYFDADMLVVSDIKKDDILGEFVVVLHPGFYKKPLSEYTYERNKNSTAYMKETDGIDYYQGCIQGGTTNNFLKMCEHVKNNIDIDLKQNIIAIYHDESHLNKYTFLNIPDKILSPEYACPSEWVAKQYENFYTSNPKILHLQKIIIK